MVANREHLKYIQRMMVASRDLAKMKVTLRGSGVRLGSGRIITFYPNTTTKKDNVAFFDDHFNLYEALRSKDASK